MLYIDSQERFLALTLGFLRQQLFAKTPVENGTRGKGKNKIPDAVIVNFESGHGKPVYDPARMEVRWREPYLETAEGQGCRQPQPEQPGTFPKDISCRDNNKEVGQDAEDQYTPLKRGIFCGGCEASAYQHRFGSDGEVEPVQPVSAIVRQMGQGDGVGIVLCVDVIPCPADERSPGSVKVLFSVDGIQFYRVFFRFFPKQPYGLVRLVKFLPCDDARIHG